MCLEIHVALRAPHPGISQNVPEPSLLPQGHWVSPEPPQCKESLGDSSGHLSPGHGSGTAPSMSLCHPQGLHTPEGSGTCSGPQGSFLGLENPKISHRGIQRGSRASLPQKLHLLSHRRLGREAGLEPHWRILGHVGIYWGMLGCSGAEWGVLGCTGMPWRFMTNTGEALGPAELQVPTSDLFTRWTPVFFCREIG